MKKVTLELGGTMYTVYFEMVEIKTLAISIKRITPMTDNCISIMRFDLFDIKNKIVLTRKMWSDV